MKSSLQEARNNYEVIAQLDPEERDRMVMDFLPEVNYIARRIHDRLPAHVPLDDLVNAGIVGLLEAIKSFDPSRHVQIKTFAKLRIQGSMLDMLREFDWCPRTVRRKARAMEETSHKLQHTLGRDPSEQEVAEAMNIGVKDLQELLTDLRGVNLGSLQALEGEEGQEEKRFKYVPNSPDEDPYYLCLRSEMRSCLTQAVSELPDRERQLLSLYYTEELTMKEVGMVLGIGEGRVSQIHSAALLRMRARLQELLSARTPGSPASHPATSTEQTTWKRS
ncbi:MAG: sigma-70 family RNA polymerase sigma factor [Terriglobia bacterium]